MASKCTLVTYFVTLVNVFTCLKYLEIYNNQHSLIIKNINKYEFDSFCQNLSKVNILSFMGIAIMQFKKVYINLQGSRCPSIIAAALETTNHIRTSTVSTNVQCTDAFIIVYAFLTSVVQDKSGRTDTAERTVSVDALPSITHIGHQFAFVQVAACVHPAGTLGTHLQKVG